MSRSLLVPGPGVVPDASHDAATSAANNAADAPDTGHTYDSATARPLEPTPATRGYLLRFAPDLDLPALAARTRLPLAELAALERGDTSRCGGDFYVRAHLRCIATALELPEDDLLLAFSRRPTVHLETVPLGTGHLGTRHLGTGHREDAPAPQPVRVQRRRRRPRVLTVLAGVALLAVLAAAVGWGVTRSSTPAPKPPPAAAAKKPPAVQHTKRVAAPAPPAIPPGTVLVSVAASGAASWLSAQDPAGQTVYQGLVQPGTSQVLRGSAVTAVIGNAGAVTVSCNNHKLGSPGGAGQVVTIRYAPGVSGC